MRRAVEGQEVMPITKMMFQTFRPSTEASTMARGRKGTTRNHSVIRISTASGLPPTNPAMIPMTDPIRMVETVAARPTKRLTREPQTNWAQTDRRM